MIRAPYNGYGAGQWYKVALVSAPSAQEDVLATKPQQAAEAWCEARLAAEDGPTCVVVIDPHTEPPFNKQIYEVSARVKVEWDAKHLKGLSDAAAKDIERGEHRREEP